MTKEVWDAQKPPIYGCITGIQIPKDRIEILPGIVLRRVYVDTFGTTTMAFAPPPTPKSPHPGPWAAVRGGFTFSGRVEVGLADSNACCGLKPLVAIWLVAAVLRLRTPTPIRLAVVANMPFDSIGENPREGQAVAFENSPHQIGSYSAENIEASEDQISWLRDTLPEASRLYHDERFSRAFSVSDQALWTPTAEMGTVLVWTAVEILFDLGTQRGKTKAICRALSEYVGESQADRDRAYQVIQDLY